MLQHEYCRIVFSAVSTRAAMTPISTFDVGRKKSLLQPGYTVITKNAHVLGDWF